MNAADVLGALDSAGFHAMRALLALAWQSTIVLCAAGATSLVLGKQRAATRRAVWMVALLAVTALPWLVELESRIDVPQARVPVMTLYVVPERSAPAPAADEAVVTPTADRVETAPAGAVVRKAAAEQRVPLSAYRWALCLAAYAGLAGLMLGLVLAARVGLDRLARRATPVTDGRVLAAFTAACERLGVKRTVRVVESARIEMPLAIGTLRPVVLLPAGFAASLSYDDLAAVALHEAAHVKRFDSLMLDLASVFRALLFFHPLVWYACRRIALLTEEAADDAVLEATHAPVAYAKTLALLAERIRSGSFSAHLAAGIIFSRSAFVLRVRAILSERRPAIRALSVIAMIGAVAGVAVSLVLAAAVPISSTTNSTGNAAPAVSQESTDVEPTVWISWLPESPVRAIGACSCVYDAQTLGEGEIKITSIDLEIRSGDGRKRLALINDPLYLKGGKDQIGRINATGEVELGRSLSQGAGNLPDGDYLLAINVNGKRASNVAALKVDSHLDITREPVLRLTALPRRPQAEDGGQSHPFAVVTAAGPQWPDKGFTRLAVSYTSLVIDGVERSVGFDFSGTKSDTIDPAQRFQAILIMETYEPWISPDKHTVAARVQGYTSEAVTVPADGAIERMWDETVPEDVRVLATAQPAKPVQGEPAYNGQTLSGCILALQSDDSQAVENAIYAVAEMGPAAAPAVPYLVRALSSVEHREGALYALRGIGEGAGAAVPALIEGIGDYNSTCRGEAAVALMRIGSAADKALLSAAESTNMYRRVWATAVLAARDGGDPQRLRELGADIGSTDSRISEEALNAATVIGPKAAPLAGDIVKAFERGGLSSDAAVNALGSIGRGAGGAVPALMSALGAKDEIFLTDVVRALGRFGPDAAPAAGRIAGLLTTEYSPLRAAAADTLGSIGFGARAAIPALTAATKDTDEFVRAAAATALARIEATNPEIITPLVEAMKDESGRVRSAAAAALLSVGPVNRDVVVAFIGALHDNWKNVQSSRAEFFRLLGPERIDCVGDLLGMLGDKDPLVRETACTALASIGSGYESAAPTLAAMLKDTQVGWGAAKALKALGPAAKAAIPALIEIVDTATPVPTGRLESTDVRTARTVGRTSFAAMIAASVLGAIGPDAKGAVPGLMRLVKAESGPWNQIQLCEDIYAIEPSSKENIDALEELSKDKNETVSAEAHHLLARVGSRRDRHVQALVDTLGSPDNMAALSAAAWLGRLGPLAASASEGLRRALGSDNLQLRAEAAHALLGIEAPDRDEPARVIVSILDSTDTMTALRASEALSEFGPAEERFAPALAAKATGGGGRWSYRSRVSAIEALGNIGPGAAAALPALTTLLRDENQLVRKAAAEAIGKIQAKQSSGPGAGSAAAAPVAASPAVGSTDNAMPTGAGPSAQPVDPKENLPIECRGKVVDAQGRPVAGAEVSLYHYLRRGPTTFVERGKASTGQDGTFDVKGTGNREVVGYVTAGKEGLAYGWDQWIPNLDEEITLTLGMPTVLAGTVVDQAGKPIAGAEVRAWLSVQADRSRDGFPTRRGPRSNSIGQFNEPLIKWLITSSDTEGRFGFKGVPEGASAFFIASAPGYAKTQTKDPTKDPKDSRGQFILDAGREDIRIVLPVEAVITGVAVEKDGGKPLARLPIVVTGDRVSEHAQPGADGAFRVGGLPAGEYKVRVMYSNSRGDWVAEPVAVSLKAGETRSGVRIEATRGALIVVHVMSGETRAPISGAGVWIESTTRDADGYSPGGSAETDANGAAQVRVLPGEYSVSNVAKSPEFEDARDGEVFKVADGETKTVEIKLSSATAQVSGIVRDEKGKPVAGATVYPWPALPGWKQTPEVTDAEGRFAGTLQNRSYYQRQTVFIVRQREMNAAAVAERPDKGRRFEIRLAPAATLAGNVTSPDGKPIAGADIQLRIDLAEGRGSVTLPASGDKVVTDANGVFEIRAVPPSPERGYNVLATAKGYGQREADVPYDEPRSGWIEVVGLVLRPANKSISGRVVDMDGKGVPDVELDANWYSGAEPTRPTQPDNTVTKTGPDGAFRLDGVTDGEIGINARDSEHKRQVQAWIKAGTTDAKIVLMTNAEQQAERAGEPRPILGKPIPGLDGLSFEPKAGDLTGKPLVVCLFDTESRPSRKVIADLATRAKELDAKGVAVLCINVGGAALEANTLPTARAEGGKKVLAAWGAKSLPWIVIADKAHMVRAEGVETAGLDAALKAAVRPQP